jgi:hypothetical protein
MKQKPRIIMAAGNALGTLWSFLFPIELIIWIARKAGYDGIQYSPIRLFAGLQVRLGLLSSYAKRYIFAAEQSPRNEVIHWREGKRAFADFLTSEQPILGVLFYILLPFRRDSMKILIKLQHLLDKKIPMVIYPYHEFEEPQYREFSQIGMRLVQPEPGLITRWRVNNYLLFQARIFTADFNRFNGICFDTDKARLMPWSWKQQIEENIDDIKLVHVRFRSKLEVKNDKSTTGVIDQELVDMINTLVKNGYSGDWVIEMPMDGLSEVIGKRWWLAIINPWYFIKAQKKLVNLIREIIEEASE